jgi:ABC-type branched-subunit amino acid transport system ATPase component
MTDQLVGTALSVRGVSVQFGSLQALINITLDLPPHGIVGVIGPNGAGKSTLLAVIGGQLVPTAGTVSLFDEDVTRLDATKRSRLGLRRTFQSLELFDELSIRDNLLVTALSAHGVTSDRREHRSNSEAVRQVSKIINELGLSHYEYVDAKLVPAAIRRWVSYGRAIVGSPRCVLLDEPAAGLSDQERQALGSRVRKDVENEGLSVVVVEHDMGFVRDLCDYVYVLDAGSIIASGTFDEIAGNAAVREAYLGPMQEPGTADS